MKKYLNGGCGRVAGDAVDKKVIDCLNKGTFGNYPGKCKTIDVGVLVAVRVSVDSGLLIGFMVAVRSAVPSNSIF